MKRRKALQHIALISAGLAFLPACDSEKWPVYSNIPLEPEQQRLMQWLTEAILPKGEVPVTTPEPRAHFVLRMVNDCHSPQEIEQYRAGLQALQQYLQAANQSALSKMSPEQSEALLQELTTAESSSEDLRYLLKTTRQLCIRHFTSSEYFLKNHLGFEFAPGRFQGCVAV
jgi:hypothetical protein